jgi:hypothetical protein
MVFAIYAASLMQAANVVTDKIDALSVLQENILSIIIIDAKSAVPSFKAVNSV